MYIRAAFAFDYSEPRLLRGLKLRSSFANYMC